MDVYNEEIHLSSPQLCDLDGIVTIG